MIENPFADTIERYEPKGKPYIPRPARSYTEETRQQKRQAIKLIPDSDDEYIRYINHWRKNPLVFIREVLGFNPWSKQIEIIESVRDNARTTVRSCSAGGKTAISACLVLWFLSSFKPAMVLTTGKSFRQIKEQLWREIRTKHAQAKIPIGGNITQTSLELGTDWFALGFSTDEPERITGFHEKHVLVIVDEACGVSDEVYGAIENPLAAGFTRLLLLGNPTQSVGKFRDTFDDARVAGNYNQIHISAYDTPAFTSEGDFPFLISRDYVEQKEKEWGEDNPLFEVYILGNFPSGEVDRLIPFGLALEAVDREVEVDEKDIIAIGVDTARFGDDENVLYVRKGNKVIDSKYWRKAETEENIGRISHEIKKHTLSTNQPPIVNIDEGYNPGIVDGLKGQNYKVNGVSFQGKAKDKVYANIRAEMFWELASRFKSGSIQIPDDKLLVKQLTDIKKKPLNRFDQILLESKQEMKQRGLKSPDRADSLALCFYEVPQRLGSPLWFVEIE